MHRASNSVVDGSPRSCPPQMKCMWCHWGLHLSSIVISWRVGRCHNTGPRHPLPIRPLAPRRPLPWRRSWTLHMRLPVVRTGSLARVLVQQHVEGWLDLLVACINLILFPLANFWALWLYEFSTNTLLRWCLPPGCGVLDGDLQHLLAPGLLVQHHFSPCSFVVPFCSWAHQ